MPRSSALARSPGSSEAPPINATRRRGGTTPSSSARRPFGVPWNRVASRASSGVSAWVVGRASEQPTAAAWATENSDSDDAGGDDSAKTSSGPRSSNAPTAGKESAHDAAVRSTMRGSPVVPEVSVAHPWPGCVPAAALRSRTERQYDSLHRSSPSNGTPSAARTSSARRTRSVGAPPRSGTRCPGRTVIRSGRARRDAWSRCRPRCGTRAGRRGRASS